LSPLEVASVPATGLAEPLALLEEALRNGEPVPAALSDRLRRVLEAGDVEVLAARAEGRLLGVAVLAYRLNISAGAPFASIEDLYVRQEARRQGVGRTLLEAVVERCAIQNISYLEVQVEENEAETFYTALGYEPEPGVRVLSRTLLISDG
jgi:GNAT superfamily N-acetyltransferase